MRAGMLSSGESRIPSIGSPRGVSDCADSDGKHSSTEQARGKLHKGVEGGVLQHGSDSHSGVTPAAAAIGPNGWLWHCGNPFKVRGLAYQPRLQCSTMQQLLLQNRNRVSASQRSPVQRLAHILKGCRWSALLCVLQLLTIPDTALACCAWAGGEHARLAVGSAAGWLAVVNLEGEELQQQSMVSKCCLLHGT